MKWLVTVGVGVVALAVGEPAIAADIASETPKTAAESTSETPKAAEYSWTGLYAGGNFGYGWADVNLNTALPNDSEAGLENLSRVIGGGQVGINWQSGHGVLGIEADIQGSRSQTSILVSQVLITDSIPWFATVRARLGFAADKSLIYLTGGAALAQFNHDLSVGGTPALNASTTLTAWTIGAGVEAAIAGSWTWKVEYLYFDYGNVSDQYAATALGALNSNARVKDNVVRVGINYRFTSSTTDTK